MKSLMRTAADAVSPFDPYPGRYLTIPERFQSKEANLSGQGEMSGGGRLGLKVHPQKQVVEARGGAQVVPNTLTSR